MKAREDAADQIYERVVQQQGFKLWKLQHLYECVGYSLPQHLQHVIHENCWIQATWTPSPEFKAVDNRYGRPEQPPFAAPHAPQDVTFDLVPHLVDDHNPPYVLQRAEKIGNLRLTDMITINTHHYLREGPLEALLLLKGKVHSFCAFFDSSPPSPISVIAYNRQNRERRFLVSQRKFGGYNNCCMSGIDKQTGKPTCHGTPDDLLCRPILARDFLRAETHENFATPIIQTPTPYSGPVMCTGCAIMAVLSGYASTNEQERASIMLTVSYDLRNRSERGPTWSPPVQPVALYQHRLKELLAQEPIKIDGKTYKPEMFDHYCQR